MFFDELVGRGVYYMISRLARRNRKAQPLASISRIGPSVVVECQKSLRWRDSDRTPRSPLQQTQRAENGNAKC